MVAVSRAVRCTLSCVLLMVLALSYVPVPGLSKSAFSNIAMLANPPPADVTFPQYRVNPECPPQAYSPASFLIEDFDASIDKVRGQTFMNVKVKGNNKGLALNNIAAHAKVVYNGWPFDYHVENLCEKDIKCPVEGDFDVDVKFEMPANLPDGKIHGIIELRSAGAMLNCEEFGFDLSSRSKSTKLNKPKKAMRTEF